MALSWQLENSATATHITHCELPVSAFLDALDVAFHRINLGAWVIVGHIETPL
jgi:hypothetical protein